MRVCVVPSWVFHAALLPQTSSTTQIVTCKVEIRAKVMFWRKKQDLRAAWAEVLTAVPEFIREGRLKLFLIRLPHTLQLHRCKLLLSGHIPFKHFAPGCTLFFSPFFHLCTVMSCPDTLRRSAHICRSGGMVHTNCTVWSTFHHADT